VISFLSSIPDSQLFDFASRGGLLWGGVCEKQTAIAKDVPKTVVMDEPESVGSKEEKLCHEVQLNACGALEERIEQYRWQYDGPERVTTRSAQAEVPRKDEHQYCSNPL